MSLRVLLRACVLSANCLMRVVNAVHKHGCIVYFAHREK